MEHEEAIKRGNEHRQNAALDKWTWTLHSCSWCRTVFKTKGAKGEPDYQWQYVPEVSFESITSHGICVPCFNNQLNEIQNRLKL